MRFKIGQEVICIANSRGYWVDRNDPNNNFIGPKKDEIVTVEGYTNGPYIFFEEYQELDHHGHRNCFNEIQFAPLADISELKEILESELLTV